MAIAARWIRLDRNGPAALRAAGGGFALAQPRRAAPAVLWAPTEDGLAFTQVVPLIYAPGRSSGWPAWALAPLIATYRQFGLRAYLDRDAVCLSGRRIAGSDAAAIGACAVVHSGFLAPQGGFMDSLRVRIESQHGWQFDHSWPTAAESGAIAEALAGEPADAG